MVDRPAPRTTTIATFIGQFAQSGLAAGHCNIWPLEIDGNNGQRKAPFRGNIAAASVIDSLGAPHHGPG
jgi:hypothetical protein